MLASPLEPAVQAQAWQCTAPNILPRPRAEYAKPADIRRTPISGYILALSWSPEYCRTRKNDSKSALQCSGSMGDFGFVLHGLWPEASGPNYPQWCKKAPVISRETVRKNICMTPDVQLLQHEWAKHGTCMTQKADSYFDAARTLYGAINFPDMARLSHDKNLNALKIADAFEMENDDLPANAVKVQTNRKSWVEEVRICMDTKFMPTKCPNFVRGAAPNERVKIWRTLP
ncbi:hypothetical protein LPB140_02375 [Sphingorhabdus lutea]|uniref:Uncharacterized protein n=1 Tax=Sphingorhabdus lutea TaxID=1913578 RepID=A0A1L3JEE2_9SPHN|nr:ribonuclease T2 [Sphingorhabdus lutea]APG63494.1 hypothetical protein LPB140_02375 [Sphingorhabdus lutea]